MTKLDQRISDVLKKVANEQEVPEFNMPHGFMLPQTEKRWTWRRFTVVCGSSVAAILLAASISSYLSPAFAAYIKSIFEHTNQDKGLQTAAIQGYAQMPDVAATDQGITISVHEIVADPTRVVIAYSIRKEDGTVLSPDLLFETSSPRKNSFSLQDAQGTDITRGFSGSDDKNYGYISFTNDQDEWPATGVTAAFDLQEVNGVQGHWRLQVPVKLDKTSAATEKLAINQAYTAPLGLQVVLKDMTFAPSANRVSLETSWTAEAKRLLHQKSERLIGKTQRPAHAANLLVEEYKLDYQIVDEQGKDVIALQHQANALSQGLVSQDREVLGQDGHYLWKDSYVPFDRAKPYTFVLKAIHKVEPVDVSFTFNPSDLQKKAISNTLEQNTFTVKAISVHSPGDRKNRAILEIDAALADISDIHPHWWRMTDGNGNSYQVTGASFETNGQDTQGREKVKMSLRIEGMQQLPKQLTLSLDAVMKRYDNLDWRAELPVGSKNR